MPDRHQSTLPVRSGCKQTDFCPSDGHYSSLNRLNRKVVRSEDILRTNHRAVRYTMNQEFAPVTEPLLRRPAAR